MGKARTHPRRGAQGNAASQSRLRSWGIAASVLVLITAVFALNRKPPSGQTPVHAKATSATNNLPAIEVNQALMVTVELDFGGTVPSVAEALKEIERRYQPDSGTGRIFAILDGYGEPTADGKKLHLSMHLSMEKPGIASLVFRRTGETLWSSRIVPTTNATPAFAGTQLSILIDNGSGKLLTVDGSRNPASVLDASIKETGQLVRDFWPESAELEVTFIYSACGCPVKVKCRRAGDRTVRTKEMPVIFPDDPPVVDVISRLMQW